MSDHPKEEKKEEKKPEKKKTPFMAMGTVLLTLLFFAIFLIIANVLLGMAFPALTETIRTTGTGLQASGAELLRANIGLKVFMNGIFGFILTGLIILLGLVGSALIAQKLVGLLKKA